MKVRRILLIAAAADPPRMGRRAAIPEVNVILPPGRMRAALSCAANTGPRNFDRTARIRSLSVNSITGP